jgi:hypothetical protein
MSSVSRISGPRRRGVAVAVHVVGHAGRVDAGLLDEAEHQPLVGLVEVVALDLAGQLPVLGQQRVDGLLHEHRVGLGHQLAVHHEHALGGVLYPLVRELEDAARAPQHQLRVVVAGHGGDDPLARGALAAQDHRARPVAEQVHAEEGADGLRPPSGCTQPVNTSRLSCGEVNAEPITATVRSAPLRIMRKAMSSMYGVSPHPPSITSA